MIVEQTLLHCKKDSSDKIYIVELETINGNNLYRRYHNLNFAYGRKDKALKTGRKYTKVSEAYVRLEYNDLIQEKTAKGYKVIKVIKNPEKSVLSESFTYDLSKNNKNIEKEIKEATEEIKGKRINIQDEL